jgi:hypothetical protein
MKFSKATLALLPLASAKLNSPKRPSANNIFTTIRAIRKLQLDGLFDEGGVTLPSNITFNGTSIGDFNGSNPFELGFGIEGMMNGTGMEGMNFTGLNGTDLFGMMMNGTDPFGGMFGMNGTDFAAMMNGTDPFAMLFNGTDIFGMMNGTDFDMMFNGTDPFAGLEDVLAGLFGNITDMPMMGGNFTDMPMMGDDMFMMGCPAGCSEEVCSIFSVESAEAPPDMGIISDACDAGTIKECSGMASAMCEPLCGADGSDETATFLGLDPTMLEEMCSFCTFLDCCDGVNSFDDCKANLPAEAFEGMTADGTTESTAEETTEEDTEEVTETTEEDAGVNTPITDMEADETTASSDATSEVDAAETEDGSPATALFMSKRASLISLVLLFTAF